MEEPQNDEQERDERTMGEEGVASSP